MNSPLREHMPIPERFLPDVPGFSSCTINLKQWRMLNAVVVCGSFSKAAEHLQVSQPAVSYAIARMEEQLGVPLLRLKGRKAQLTEQGSTLLERARALLREAVELEELAESIRRGNGPQIQLAVDRSFPTQILLPEIGRFSLHGRNVKVHLSECASSEVDQALQSKAVDLAIMRSLPNGFQGEALMSAEYIPVAHPAHPLFHLKRELTQADLDRELRVVGPCEPADLDGRFPPTLHSARSWTVSNPDTAESAIGEGIGYGWLPRHRIDSALRSGRLRMLPVAGVASRHARFHIVYARPGAPSSDVHRLAEVLHRTAATFEGRRKPNNDTVSMTPMPVSAHAVR